MEKQKSLLVLTAMETLLTFTQVRQCMSTVPEESTGQEMLCTDPSPVHPGCSLSQHQHKPKPPHLKHCRQTCTLRATQLP